MEKIYNIKCDRKFDDHVCDGMLEHTIGLAPYDDSPYWICPKCNSTYDEREIDERIKSWSPLERLENLSDSFWEEARENQRLKHQIMKHQYKRVRKFWKSIPKEERFEFIQKFIKWEEKYERYWLEKRHTQTSSNLWGLFTRIIEKRGKDVTHKYNEDFLGQALEWKNFTLKTYCGQGCFDRLFYKEKEIFQTT